MYDFIAIDFETASAENYSACSLGMAFVKDLEIVDTKYFLIQPPTLVFGEKNIQIHGILPQQVKDAPRFDIVWEEIKQYFTEENLIIAHNAKFDMSVLKCSLKFYDIEIPSFFYTDSIRISTKICTGEIGRSLKSRAEFFNINMEEHHNALSDAKTCAKIVIESIKRSKQKRKCIKYFINFRAIKIDDFQSLKEHKAIGNALFEKIAYSEIATTQEVDKGHFLYCKNVAITGDFETLNRKSIIQKLTNCGAIVQNSVTTKTNILIAGNYDKNIFVKDNISTKEKKALAFIDKGHDIKIINEQEFLSLIST